MKHTTIPKPTLATPAPLRAPPTRSSTPAPTTVFTTTEGGYSYGYGSGYEDDIIVEFEDGNDGGKGSRGGYVCAVCGLVAVGLFVGLAVSVGGWLIYRNFGEIKRGCTY